MEVLGWSPSGDYEEVDVRSMFRTPLEGTGNRHGELKPYATSFDNVPASHPSSSFLPSSSSVPPPYYKTVPPRRPRDPDHIPRPRNSFIIFRCDYTRKHCNGASDPDSSDAEKRSLSKRAGEAWKNVSADIKRHYKRLADQEREEHARRNPEYRFRPRRRQSSGQGRRHVPKEKVALETAGGNAEHALPEENSRSRSSSLSSIESSQSSARTVSPVFGQSSIDPSHSPISHLSSCPKFPYTPVDRPTEPSSYFGKSSRPDPVLSFSYNPDADINDLFFNCDDSQLLLFGDLSRYPASSCGLPAIENPPTQTTMLGHAPPPLEVVASSLAGWNGDEGRPKLARSDNQSTFAPPGGTFEYEYKHLSPETYPPLDGYATAVDTSSFESDIQNNLNAYVSGLNDYGIGCNISGFDLVPSLSL